MTAPVEQVVPVRPGPPMVRNTSPGPAVFSDGGYHVEWAGAGDHMGNDLQSVPLSFLENVNFHRMVERGIFEIETDQTRMDRAAGLHRKEFTDRMEAMRTASFASLDQAPDNDSLVKGCIGPSANAQALCGAQVPVKVNKQSEKPPLCTQHIELANQFVATEGDRVVSGKAEIVWRRIQIDARTRQD